MCLYSKLTLSICDATEVRAQIKPGMNHTALHPPITGVLSTKRSSTVPPPLPITGTYSVNLTISINARLIIALASVKIHLGKRLLLICMVREVTW